MPWSRGRIRRLETQRVGIRTMAVDSPNASSPSARNRTVITELQQRCQGLRRWMVIHAALLFVSVCGCFSTFFVNPRLHGDAAAVVMIVAVIFFGIGFGGLLLCGSDY